MIQEVIPQQNFELVRDAIGAIIASEIENQKIKNMLLNEEVSVYVERTTPMADGEEVIINVVLASGDYDQKTQKDSQGKTFFNIDMYTRGKASFGQSGSFNSAFKLHRYIGIVRYILQHTMYKTLSFPPGFIGGTMVENFQIFENQNREDTDFSKMGTISFSVRIQENQTMEQGVDLKELFTMVKLEMTDLGYIYTKIN